MIYWLMERPELVRNYKLSHFRHLVFSAAPVAPENIKKATKLFDCGAILIGGMTESSGVASASVVDDVQNKSLEILASAGKETVVSWLKVIDDNGHELPRDQVGELLIKGPMVMKGYWKNPEATTEIIEDGWLYTGDLVKIDQEGNLYYVDRKKDMIKTGGENVYSKEVEETISTHPAVLDVAIIGVPDEIWGEAIKSIIELNPGMTATEQEIIEHCKANLARFKAPKSVVFVEKGTLPRGGLGKIQKNVLREKYT